MIIFNEFKHIIKNAVGIVHTQGGERFTRFELNSDETEICITEHELYCGTGDWAIINGNTISIYIEDGYCKLNNKYPLTYELYVPYTKQE